RLQVRCNVALIFEGNPLPQAGHVGFAVSRAGRGRREIGLAVRSARDAGCGMVYPLRRERTSECRQDDREDDGFHTYLLRTTTVASFVIGLTRFLRRILAPSAGAVYDGRFPRFPLRVQLLARLIRFDWSHTIRSMTELAFCSRIGAISLANVTLGAR